MLPTGLIDTLSGILWLELRVLGRKSRRSGVIRTSEHYGKFYANSTLRSKEFCPICPKRSYLETKGPPSSKNDELAYKSFLKLPSRFKASTTLSRGSSTSFFLFDEATPFFFCKPAEYEYRKRLPTQFLRRGPVFWPHGQFCCGCR